MDEYVKATLGVAPRAFLQRDMLTDQQLRAYVLCEVRGLKHRDAAELLSTTRQNVGKLVAKAKPGVLKLTRLCVAAGGDGATFKTLLANSMN